MVSNKNWVLLKVTGQFLVMQVSFRILVLLMESMNDTLAQPLRIGFAFFFIGLLFILCFFFVGLVLRSAYLAHIFIMAISLTWAVPFLITGYKLSSQNLPLIFFVVVMSLANIYVNYYSTLRALNTDGFPVVQSGRLDQMTGFWNLERHLYIEKDRSAKMDFAKSLIPIGSALGVLLYRNFSIYTSLWLVVSSYTIGILLMAVAGIHLAATSYVISLQNKLDIRIRI